MDEDIGRELFIDYLSMDDDDEWIDEEVDEDESSTLIRELNND